MASLVTLLIFALIQWLLGQNEDKSMFLPSRFTTKRLFCSKTCNISFITSLCSSQRTRCWQRTSQYPPAQCLSPLLTWCRTNLRLSQIPNQKHLLGKPGIRKSKKIPISRRGWCLLPPGSPLLSPSIRSEIWWLCQRTTNVVKVKPRR